MFRKCLGVFTVTGLLLGLSACVTETTGGFQRDSNAVIVQNYLQVARAYLQSQDYNNVRSSLDTVASYDPDNSEMFGIWGLVYAQEGDLELADENFRKALRLDRTNSLTRNNYAAFLFSNNRLEEAYEQLALVVQDTGYEGRPQAFENLGITALRLDRPDDARDAFNRALQLNPNMVRSLTELIDIALDRNEIAPAQSHYNTILTLQQFYGVVRNPRNLLQGIRLAQVQGNGGQVTELAQMLAENFPNSREYRIYKQSIVNE